MRTVILILAASSLLPGVSFAHGGGLDASGCHHDRKRGGYHCHRGGGGGGSPNRVRSAYTPPKPSYNKETVRQVQALLTELSYKPGPVDGVPGRATRQAIAAFNIDYTGYIDVESYDSVLSALERYKREKVREAEKEERRRVAETAQANTTVNAFSSSTTTEKEGGIGGWLLGLFAVIGAYWLGARRGRR